MQNFEIPPDNAQKIDSIMYEILQPRFDAWIKYFEALLCLKMPWERENLLSHQGKNTAAEGGSSLYKRPLVYSLLS